MTTRTPPRATRRAVLAGLVTAPLAAMAAPALAAAEGDAHLTALESKWHAADAAWRATSTEAELNACVDVQIEIEKEIAAAPAEGLVGAAVKLRRLLCNMRQFGGTAWDMQGVETALATVERLDGRAAS